MARMKKKVLTPAARKAREKAIIADLKAGKLSYREIAAKHGVSLPTVNSKARKAGITRPRGRKPGVKTTVRRKAAKKTARRKATKKKATRKKATKRKATRKKK